MTCDFKSVKSRSAWLLRSTANRWVFMLFIDVSNEVEKVEILWDIKNKKQLRQWVESQFNKIIKMLNKLKVQQDMILKCIKHWIIMQIKYNKRLNQLEINDHYVKKLITHVIYLNLMIQDHMINIASMLIVKSSTT